jgi:hypothetical protein
MLPMVIRARHGSSSYAISLTGETLAIAFDDNTVAAWDRGGRLYSLYRNQQTWRRGLNGRGTTVQQVGHLRERRECSDESCGALLDETALTARTVHEAIATPEWIWHLPPSDVTLADLQAVLPRCGRFDAAFAADDAERFARVYQPVGVLPPDLYLSLVVQATEGCPHGGCAFCALYGIPYRVRTKEQFRSHLADVFAYLGESARLRCHGVFLGSANALSLPMAQLRQFFDVLARDADGIQRGVYGFIDAFPEKAKSARDYQTLGTLGLRRAYIGLESGHDPLLKFVGKLGSARAIVDVVRTIKEAGLHVGVMVITGLGGVQYFKSHMLDTAQALTQMGLGPGDLLYFSELVEKAGSAYWPLAAQAGLTPLGSDECQAQRNGIRANTQFVGGSPQIASYDIRAFVY